MGSQNEWTGWWVQADQEKIFAKTSQALRERLQVPSKSHSSTCIQFDAPTINSSVTGKRKATSQHVHPSNKKLHELPYSDESPREEIVNRPIITSMTSGYRGKQFIYRKDPVILQDHSVVSKQVVGNGSKIPDHPTMAKGTPQTVPSISKVNGVDSSRKEFDEAIPRIVKHPSILHGLTRSHSLALSDINGFEDFGEQNHFINPFENDSGTETPSKATSTYQCASKGTNLTSNRISDLRVTFKDVISEEKKDHSGTKKYGKALNPSMSKIESLKGEKVMTTPILLPSNSKNPDKTSILPQLSKPRRTFLRENSLAFSDDEEGDLALDEKFENPFENEH